MPDQQHSSAWADFKKFLLQGSAVDVAVGLVLALAFKAVVDVVVDIVTNILAIPGVRNGGLANKSFTIGGGVFRYGALFQAIVSFVLIAAILFFVVVRPVSALMRHRARDADTGERECPECRSAIPKEATRCRYCTAQVTPAA
jgi:large conductance mechanosensitive channel